MYAKRIITHYYSITNAAIFATIKYKIGGIFYEIFTKNKKNRVRKIFMRKKSLILKAAKGII